MTLGEVYRFEVWYRFHQRSTWVYALVLIGMPFLLMHAINGSSLRLNAPVSVMNIATVMGAIAMLVTAGIFGDAAARDVQTRMHSLFHTSPIKEPQYLAGRFLGSLTVNAVLLLGVPLGLLLASVMPYMPAGKFGAVQLMAYAQAYVLLLLPNLVIIGACMFAAAALTRHPLATYLGGVVLYIIGTVAGDLTDGFSNLTLSALVDPFGGRAIAFVTQLWTPAESNERLIGWPSVLLMNRAIWLTMSLGVIAALIGRFRFAHDGGGERRRWWKRRVVVDTAPEKLTPLTAVRPSLRRDAEVGTFSLGVRFKQVLEIAARMWREIAATRVSLLILVGALVFVIVFGWDVGAEVYGTSTWPVTHLIAGTVLSTALGPVMALLIAISAGELVWRERDVGIGDIVAVTPVPNAVSLLGRFLALVAMLATLQLVLMLAGIALQTIRGWHQYELSVYFKLLFGLKLVDYVLLAALAMAVHVIVNHKYVGHLLVVLYFASTVASGIIGINHRMLVYASDPGWVWSDFNGLEPFLQGIVWFKAYWAAWALLFGVLANLFWVRGRERGAGARLALARQRLRGPGLRAGVLAVSLIVLLGGFVFYNTNVLNTYRTPKEEALLRVEYEKKYKRYQGAPEPSLVKVRTRVEFFPSERAAEVTGDLTFVNRTADAIDTLHVLPSAEVETHKLEFNRPTQLVLSDSALNYRMYSLGSPLAPGDSVVMHFEVARRPRGFRNNGEPTDITPNGAHIEQNWLPSLGYSAAREVGDETFRREHGLPPRTLPPSAGDVDTRSGANDVVLVDAEMVIGTDTSQVAISPGTLVREWKENGRRYFHYKTDEPLRYSAVVHSGKYAVKETTWHGMPLRVFYHPTHDVNVDRMLKSMQASLAYYSAQFGPYQFKELRVVEFPRYQSFARAHPFTIAFSEGGAFLTRVDSGEIERTFFVVAHETAHQWWGGQVIPAQAAGAALVSETLAQYSSMMVLEKTFGARMAKKFFDYHMAEYFRGRTVYTNRETPLIDMVGAPYLHYFKGGLAMYTLRDRLGENTVNGALRTFREKYAGANAPPATSRALYTELQAVTPDSLKPLLSDLFEHITLWNLRADSARAKRVDGGSWRVTLYVDAHKARADSIGRETPIEMDDLVEIGVFGAPAEGKSDSEPLYLRQHRVRSGKQTIEITVPKLPTSAGIDPNAKFIQRERDDNIVEIPAASAKAKR